MTGEDSIVEAGGVHYWLISVGFILKAILSLFVMALFFAENHQTAKCFIRAQHSCFLASVLALVIAELLILMSISNTGYVTQYPAAFWLIDFAPVGCLWITLEVTSRIYRALPRTRPRATVRKPEQVTFRNTCIAVASYLSPALCRAVHGRIEEDTYFAISSTAMLLTFSSVWGMGGINEAIQASRDAHVIVDPLVRILYYIVVVVVAVYLSLPCIYICYTLFLDSISVCEI
jgi:hypothetical protein